MFLKARECQRDFIDLKMFIQYSAISFATHYFAMCYSVFTTPYLAFSPPLCLNFHHRCNHGTLHHLHLFYQPNFIYIIIRVIQVDLVLL